jgi:hypothetical protein
VRKKFCENAYFTAETISLPSLEICMSSLHPFVAEALKHLHTSPEEAARVFAITEIRQKIRSYEKEMYSFEQKYGMSFEDFSKRMESRQNEENFEESDNWNDWRSSIALTQRYKEQLETLTSLSNISALESA